MTGNADAEAVRSYYEYVDATDVESLLDLFAPDVTYDRPGQASIEGRDELRAFYETGRPLEDGSHELDSVVAGDDTVAVRGRFTGRQDGDRVAFGFADFHTFDDDGRIAYRASYTDRDTV